MTHANQPPPAPWPSAPAAGGAPGRRQRRSRWLTVGLPVLGVLLLGGCATAAVLLVHVARDAIGPARHAAEDYAGALTAQRWNDASRLLCSQDQAALSPAALAGHYREPAVTGYRLDAVRVTSTNGRETGRAEVTLTRSDGLRDHLTLPLSKDGAGWHPCP